MSYQSRRNDLIQAIANAFSARLPDSLPEQYRQEIIEGNLEVGQELADAFLVLLNNARLTQPLLQNLLQGNVNAISIASLIS